MGLSPPRPRCLWKRPIPPPKSVSGRPDLWEGRERQVGRSQSAEGWGAGGHERTFRSAVSHGEATFFLLGTCNAFWQTGKEQSKRKRIHPKEWPPQASCSIAGQHHSLCMPPPCRGGGVSRERKSNTEPEPFILVFTPARVISSLLPTPILAHAQHLLA